VFFCIAKKFISYKTMAKGLGHKGLSKNVHKTAIGKEILREKGAFTKKRCQENLSIVR